MFVLAFVSCFFFITSLLLCCKHICPGPSITFCSGIIIKNYRFRSFEIVDLLGFGSVLFGAKVRIH